MYTNITYNTIVSSNTKYIRCYNILLAPNACTYRANKLKILLVSYIKPYILAVLIKTMEFNRMYCMLNFVIVVTLKALNALH